MKWNHYITKLKVLDLSKESQKTQVSSNVEISWTPVTTVDIPAEGSRGCTYVQSSIKKMVTVHKATSGWTLQQLPNPEGPRLYETSVKHGL